jgi:RNA polymerase sigma-70 factor (ECF subfamily)
VPDVTPTSAQISADPAALAVLLASASRGEADAWRTLMDLYSRRVFALAKSRCRSPELAEEITQSVFVTIATKLSQNQYTEKGRFESWLFRVAMNRIRDEARRVKRQAAPTEPETLAAMADRTRSGSPDGASGRDEESASELNRLRECMDELADADREIIELRHHGQMSFAQMSEMLDEPVGTLLARHHRALKKLKEMMGERSQPAETNAPSERSLGLKGARIGLEGPQ